VICHAAGVSELGRLVHLDDRVVVIGKPAGVSLATRRDQPRAAVDRLLATLASVDRRRLAGHEDDLLLAHRLDVGTTGLVVLARGPSAHRELVMAFALRAVEKAYLAVVWGRPRPVAGRWSWPLGPDCSDRRRMRVDPGGRAAVTRYRVVAGPRFASLLVLYPETGRTHQLRVHLAHAGHPIVGDDLYGGPRHRGVRDREVRRHLQPAHPLLHAWRLVVPASEPHGELRLEAAPGADFEAALRALGVDLPSSSAIAAYGEDAVRA